MSGVLDPEIPFENNLLVGCTECPCPENEGASEDPLVAEVSLQQSLGMWFGEDGVVMQLHPGDALSCGASRLPQVLSMHHFFLSSLSSTSVDLNCESPNDDAPLKRQGIIVQGVFPMRQFDRNMPPRTFNVIRDGPI